MALVPEGGIGTEVHTLDQFVRLEEGTGEAILPHRIKSRVVTT